MTKLEFFAANLPNKLKVKVLCGDGYYDSIVNLTMGRLYELGASRFVPIIRSFDSLTKEITQANYNEGKPFVPIVDLAKIADCRYQWELVGEEAVYNTGHWFMRFGFDGKDFIYYNGNRINNQLQLFQQLLIWHFWPNMPEGEEVAYVTKTFNPYE